MLAERYGWTLEQIKQIPREEVHVLLEIIKVKNKIQENQYKEAKHKSR